VELPISWYRSHAEYRARRSPSGIGASVVEYRVETEHRWSCIVSDRDTYRYLEVRSDQFSPWQRVSPLVVESALERLASRLPQHHRLYHLVNANPLHLTRDGQAVD
jgi:hypothetical protein